MMSVWVDTEMNNLAEGGLTAPPEDNDPGSGGGGPLGGGPPAPGDPGSSDGGRPAVQAEVQAQLQ